MTLSIEQTEMYSHLFATYGREVARRYQDVCLNPATKTAIHNIKVKTEAVTSKVLSHNSQKQKTFTDTSRRLKAAAIALQQRGYRFSLAECAAVVQVHPSNFENRPELKKWVTEIASALPDRYLFFVEKAIAQLQENGVPISNARVSEVSGVKVRTIRNRKDLRDRVKEARIYQDYQQISNPKRA